MEEWSRLRGLVLERFQIGVRKNNSKGIPTILGNFLKRETGKTWYFKIRQWRRVRGGVQPGRQARGGDNEAEGGEEDHVGGVAIRQLRVREGIAPRSGMMRIY